METRLCRKCGNYHEIFYVKHKNDTNHLLMICGRAYIHIPYEAGLNINTHLNKYETKKNKTEEKTQTLF